MVQKSLPAQECVQKQGGGEDETTFLLVVAV